MNRFLSRLFIGVVSVLPGLIGSGCGEPIEKERINIARALSSTSLSECYEKAEYPIHIEFPKDAGPHNTFQTEWWYYTGNLETGQGRHFGYQLTFFRQALSCEPVQGASKWRTRQLYFAHFAVTDTQSDRFYSDFRMNRQSLGIAGARADPYTVWIDDWRAAQAKDHLALTAKGEKTRIQLTLSEEKPMILQGKLGLSQKGKDASNASYYYSLPRLGTKGRLEIGSDIFSVTGNSWFDHEWSTSALGTDVAGWDWFSVHLDDGRDLMVCQVRRSDGTPNGYGFGSISFPDGTVEILSEDRFAIQVKGYWTSPATSRRYPNHWKISLPGHGIVLDAVPVVTAQEHTHMFAYWEGAVRFSGNGINGLGYVELTGY